MIRLYQKKSILSFKLWITFLYLCRYRIGHMDYLRCMWVHQLLLGEEWRLLLSLHPAQVALKAVSIPLLQRSNLMNTKQISEKVIDEPIVFYLQI